MREANPIPQGKYVPAKRWGNMIFTAGMTPRDNGVLVKSGIVVADAEIDEYRDAVRQAAKNALVAAQNLLNEGEEIAELISFTVFVNCESEFIRESKIADLASEYYTEQLGEHGAAARAAIGVAALPGDAPCEIQITVGVK